MQRTTLSEQTSYKLLRTDPEIKICAQLSAIKQSLLLFDNSENGYDAMVSGGIWNVARSPNRLPLEPPAQATTNLNVWAKSHPQRGGSIAQWLAYLLPDPADRGLIPSVPKKIKRKKFINVAEINQQRCLEESGQWLENVDQIHLVLASGKLEKTRVLFSHPSEWFPK